MINDKEKPHGYGVMINYELKTVYVGEWSKGRLEGQGIKMEYFDGDRHEDFIIYEGMFKKTKSHGLGRETGTNF